MNVNEDRVISLTAGEVRLVMLILKDITTAMSVEESTQRDRFIKHAISRIRQLGSTIWQKILTPEDWSVVQRTLREEIPPETETV